MPEDTRPADQRQCAAAVMMVRPVAFGFNRETEASNHFQQREAATAGTPERGLAEFDALEAALRHAGVATFALADQADPARPDAVFPNNWVSFHADGTVVLYPMLAPTRRRERRMELLLELELRGGFELTRLLDLSRHEMSGRFLEGTGSVVFDHPGRIAYAFLSPRTDERVLGELGAELGYEPCAFRAADAAGVPVYHTNVVLSIGSRSAIVCADAVAATDRPRLMERLAAGGRAVVGIDRRQMANFAGNALELGTRGGERVLAMSARALGSLAGATREVLQQSVDRVVAVPVPTIEDVGGGSVRCMLAEVFLPRRPGTRA